MMKLFAAVLLTVALGIGVVYAVNRVGDLNGRAIIIEAGLKTPQSKPQAKSCPDHPLSEAEANNLRREANTLGDLGWLAVLFLIFGVGGTVLEYIRD